MLPDEGPDREQVQQASESAYDRLREAMLTGVTVVVPLLVTVYVLSAAVGVVSNLLNPLVVLFEQFGVASDASETIVDIVAVGVVLVVTAVVGIVASFQPGERVIEYFDNALERIPGIGAIYKAFRQMSDVMLESDADNFQSVKLVEFPNQDVYTLGYLTTETPDPIAAAAGHEEMQTLFLPFAPNPVMGGHLVHVPKDRVMDVDMTVEEGMRAIVTMGVAISAGGHGADGLSQQRLEQLGGRDVAESKTLEDSE